MLKHGKSLRHLELDVVSLEFSDDHSVTHVARPWRIDMSRLALTATNPWRLVVGVEQSVKRFLVGGRPILATGVLWALDSDCEGEAFGAFARRRIPVGLTGHKGRIVTWLMIRRGSQGLAGFAQHAPRQV